MATEKRLIDANAVDKDIRENNRENFNRLDWSSKQVCQLLENAPTVDAVEVVHGSWRWCGSDRWNDAYQCSNCGKIAMNDSNYCPNCGAKMDGERKSDG